MAVILVLNYKAKIGAGGKDINTPCTNGKNGMVNGRVFFEWLIKGF